MEKAKTRIVPIKMQGTGYENREESASESSPLDNPKMNVFVTANKPPA